MGVIISEPLRGSEDEKIEVVELRFGNIWVHLKGNEATIFDSADNFVKAVYFNEVVPKKQCREDGLFHVYDTAKDWHDIDLIVSE